MYELAGGGGPKQTANQNKTVVTSCRLTLQERLKLDQMAEDYGKSRAELIEHELRQMIKRGLPSGNLPKKKKPLSWPAVQCPLCKDKIYSRAFKDEHSCSCKAINVRGGRDHFGYGINYKMRDKLKYLDKWFPQIICEMLEGVTQQDLYLDFMKKRNHYGKIKTKKVVG